MKLVKYISDDDYCGFVKDRIYEVEESPISSNLYYIPFMRGSYKKNRFLLVPDVLFYVKCINAGNCRGIYSTPGDLYNGEIYPVIKEEIRLNLYVILGAVSSGYWKERFEKIDSGDIFNIGDEVTIREDLVVDKLYLNGMRFDENMKCFMGKKFRIAKKLMGGVNNFLGYGLNSNIAKHRIIYWYFTPDMFEEYVHPHLKKENEYKMNYDILGKHHDVPCASDCTNDDCKCICHKQEKENKMEKEEVTIPYGIVKTVTKAELKIPEYIHVTLFDRTVLQFTKEKFIALIISLCSKNSNGVTDKLDAVALWESVFGISLSEAETSVDYLLETL